MLPEPGHRTRPQSAAILHHGHVRLSITDNGRGFVVDPNFQAYGGHWGLLGMRERVTQVHGKLRVRSSPGQGTKSSWWFRTRPGERCARPTLRPRSSPLPP
jgi:nitrate/nitrite-specific signal transduction histidine kinase